MHPQCILEPFTLALIDARTTSKKIPQYWLSSAYLLSEDISPVSAATGRGGGLCSRKAEQTDCAEPNGKLACVTAKLSPRLKTIIFFIIPILRAPIKWALHGEAGKEVGNVEAKGKGEKTADGEVDKSNKSTELQEQVLTSTA